MPTTDRLWGGTLTGFNVDAAAAKATLSVRVLSDGVVTDYALLLQGLRTLRLNRADSQWDYAEVTEVHLAEHAAGTFVEVVLWDEASGGITAECSAVEVAVVGG